MRAIVCAGAIAVAGAGLSGCGGGERQDANEPSGTFKVRIVDAAFPARQAIADKATMRIRVRNADTRAVPNVAVTIETTAKGSGGAAAQAFSTNVQDASLSDPSRPVWVVEEGPAGGDTAYTNTWALGPLQPGATREFVWRVTPVKPGAYTVAYSVSPGLTGKAKPAAGAGDGAFQVTIDDTPPSARVGDDGEVIRSTPSGDGSS